MDDYTALLRYLDIQAEKYHEYGCSDISDSIYDSLARRVGRTTVGAKSTVGGGAGASCPYVKFR